MSRLRFVACGSAFVVVALAYALPPLLPDLAETYGLNEVQLGLLVAVYQVGQLVAAIPFGLIGRRLGSKNALLGGLSLLCLTSLTFGLSNEYGLLLLSRFVQGAASVLCWSAGMSWIVEIDGSRRRGQAISTVTGAGAAGAVVGPLAGALAGAVGMTLAFSCLAALVVPLIVVAGATPAGDVQAGASRHYVFHEKRRSRHKILIALWLVALPSISLAALSVVGPLQLHQTGWGAGGIAASYLTAAVVGVVGRPIVGRYSDRRGRLAPIFMILLVCLPVMLLIAWIRARFMLAGLFATAVLFYGALWGPSMALLADEWEEIGVTQVLGFALMYLITAPVGVIGSFGGGALAAGAGDRTVLLCIAALSLGSVFVIRRLLRRQINEPRQSVLA